MGSNVNSNKAAAPVGTPAANAAKPILGEGSQGDDVVALQKELSALGFNPGKPDGFLGGKTVEAIKAFQRSKGLKDDGAVGSVTRAALTKAHVAAEPKHDAAKVTQTAAAQAGAKVGAHAEAILNYPAKKAETPKSRLEEQKESAGRLLDNLKENAKIALIANNPLYAIPANYIVISAQARAINRYENEVPRKDYSVLLNEEMKQANKDILDLPNQYAKYGQKALDGIALAGEGALALGAVAVNWTYDMGSAAVTSIAETGSSVGHAIADEASREWTETKREAVVAYKVSTTPVRWFGGVMKSFGDWMSGVGK